jgi:hypothetical protein
MERLQLLIRVSRLTIATALLARQRTSKSQVAQPIIHTYLVARVFDVLFYGNLKDSLIF